MKSGITEDLRDRIRSRKNQELPEISVGNVGSTGGFRSELLTSNVSSAGVRGKLRVQKESSKDL